MSCRFAHNDAAYVLGALSPADRLDFERHLSTCEHCTRSVRELAGLPGLLGRVDDEVLADQSADRPLPDTLLPALVADVRRARRRRTYAGLGAAVAAAAAVAAVTVPVVGWQLGDDPDRDGGSAATGQPTAGATSSEGPEPRTMDPVGHVPVRAEVSLEPVTWGTRLGLTCTYDPDSVGPELPSAVDYLLYVRTRDGGTERVGSWRSVGGRTMQLQAATAARPEDIASVEVRTTDGRVVLRLAA